MPFCSKFRFLLIMENSIDVSCYFLLIFKDNFYWFLRTISIDFLVCCFLVFYWFLLDSYWFSFYWKKLDSIDFGAKINSDGKWHFLLKKLGGESKGNETECHGLKDRGCRIRSRMEGFPERKPCFQSWDPEWGGIWRSVSKLGRNL